LCAGLSRVLSLCSLTRSPPLCSGPSVLYIPEARAEGQQASWNWSQGRQGAGDAAPESAAERAATAHAVGAGVNEQIEQQLLFAEHAKRLREEAREEALERGRGRGRVCLLSLRACVG